MNDVCTTTATHGTNNAMAICMHKNLLSTMCIGQYVDNIRFHVPLSCRLTKYAYQETNEASEEAQVVLVFVFMNE